MTVVPSIGENVAALNRDLNRVSEWCDLWGIKLNAIKTKTKIVSRSGTVHPHQPH